MEKQFSTTNIVLAAYLKAKGYKLADIVRHGNRGTFVFDEVPSAVITEYDLEQALVEPIALNNQIRALSAATRR